MPSNTTPYNNSSNCIRGSAHCVRFAFRDIIKAKPSSETEFLLLG